MQEGSAASQMRSSRGKRKHMFVHVRHKTAASSSPAGSSSGTDKPCGLDDDDTPTFAADDDGGDVEIMAGPASGSTEAMPFTEPPALPPSSTIPPPELPRSGPPLDPPPAEPPPRTCVPDPAEGKAGFPLPPVPPGRSCCVGCLTVPMAAGSGLHMRSRMPVSGLSNARTTPVLSASSVPMGTTALSATLDM